MDDARLAEVSRRLRSRCDAILGAVWFMPEATAGYAGIELDPAAAGLASRAACMGRVPGVVAAAAFAPLEPRSVASLVDRAWRVTDPEALLEARLTSATAFLSLLLPETADEVDRAVEVLRPVAEAADVGGHPVYAGLRSLPWPDTPLGRLWRASDLVREHRGDSHVNAFVAAGIDPLEVNLLSELWRGAPLYSVATWQMGWPKDDAEAACERLRGRGWLTDDDGGAPVLTPAGRAVRDDVERATDRQERPLVEALGDDVDELFALLDPWARTVTAVARPWWEQRGVPAGHP